MHSPASSGVSASAASPSSSVSTRSSNKRSRQALSTADDSYEPSTGSRGRGSRKLNSAQPATKAVPDDGKAARKVARMERNRQAAQISRDRKKEYVETLEAKIRELEAQVANGHQALAAPPSPAPSSVQQELFSSQSPQPVFTVPAEVEASSSIETEALKRENADLQRENADLRAAVAKEQADKLNLWQRFDSLESKFESFLHTQKPDSTSEATSSSPTQSPASIAQPHLTQEPVAQPLVARERSSLPRKPTSSCLNGSTILQPQKSPSQQPLHRPPTYRPQHLTRPSGSHSKPRQPSSLPPTLTLAQQKQAARMLARLISRRPQAATTPASTSLRSSRPTPAQVLTQMGLHLWIRPSPTGPRQNKKPSSQSLHFVFKH